MNKQYIFIHIYKGIKYSQIYVKPQDVYTFVDLGIL